MKAHCSSLTKTMAMGTKHTSANEDDRSLLRTNDGRRQKARLKLLAQTTEAVGGRASAISLALASNLTLSLAIIALS
jgi:hypothetical protein